MLYRDRTGEKRFTKDTKVDYTCFILIKQPEKYENFLSISPN